MRHGTLFFKHVAWCLALALTGYLAPGSTGTCFAQLSEPDVLLSTADNGIAPSLARAAQTAADLEQAVRQLCDHPDSPALETARKAWHNAYLAWCSALPFMIGSLSETERKIGKWPANGVVIDAAVTQEDLAHLLKNTDTRGYAAVEHMLFTPKDAKAAIADGRKAHLQDVTREIAALTATMEAAWQNDIGIRFKQAGDGNPFLLPADALSLLLARVLNTTEVMLRDRIGLPSNFFESPSRPDFLDGWESRSTRDAFQATVQGIRQAMVGDPETGLTRLVAVKDGLYEHKDPELAEEIRGQLDKIAEIFSGYSGSDLDFHARVNEKPAYLKTVYKEMNELQELIVNAALVLELDVRSGLEVQLTQ